MKIKRIIFAEHNDTCPVPREDFYTTVFLEVDLDDQQSETYWLTLASPQGLAKKLANEAKPICFRALILVDRFDESAINKAFDDYLQEIVASAWKE